MAWPDWDVRSKCVRYPVEYDAAMDLYEVYGLDEDGNVVKEWRIHGIVLDALGPFLDSRRKRGKQCPNPR